MESSRYPIVPPRPLIAASTRELAPDAVETMRVTVGLP